MLKAIILHKPCICDEPLLSVMLEHAALAWSSHLSLSSYGFLYVWVLKEHKPENPMLSLFYWRLSSCNVVLRSEHGEFKQMKTKAQNNSQCHMATGFCVTLVWTNGQCIKLTFLFVRAMCTTVRRFKKSLSFLSLSIHFRCTQCWANSTGVTN